MMPLAVADLAHWDDRLAPDLCDPSQFYASALAKRLEPYRNLAAALCLVSLTKMPNETDAQRRAANEAWFATTRGPTSFAAVAELLSVEPQRLAAALRHHTGSTPHRQHVRHSVERIEAAPSRRVGRAA